MLLEPGSGSLAPSCDGILERLSDELSLHASPETHASVIEMRTGVHTDVAGVVGELVGLRSRLGPELGELRLVGAAAGTYPHDRQRGDGGFGRRALPPARRLAALARASGADDGAARPRRRARARGCHPARQRAPRRTCRVLIALSANSPFSQGRDSGFDSMRTVIFQAFPRTGLPRSLRRLRRLRGRARRRDRSRGRTRSELLLVGRATAAQARNRRGAGHGQPSRRSRTWPRSSR